MIGLKTVEDRYNHIQMWNVGLQGGCVEEFDGAGLKQYAGRFKNKPPSVRNKKINSILVFHITIFQIRKLFQSVRWLKSDLTLKGQKILEQLLFHHILFFAILNTMKQRRYQSAFFH